MDWFQPIIDWAKTNETTLWWLFAASLVLVLLTPPVLAWAVIRLPPDYFTAERRRPLDSPKQRSVSHVVWLIFKNLLGTALLIAGIPMLIMPGQGLLTIAVALILLDFPAKYRIERWLATRSPVWRSLNWLRRRAGHAPLEMSSRPR